MTQAFQVRHGSSKDVIMPEPSRWAREIQLLFTDRFSVFDVGKVPYEIEDMGAFRHAIAVRMFALLSSCSIPNHFKRSFASKKITVEPFCIDELGQYFDHARGKIVPLEIIDRQEVTEPLLVRAAINAELLGKMQARVRGPMVVGTRFTSPLIECTTKFEPIDRRLSDLEAIKIARLGEASYTEMCGLVAKASTILTEFFAFRGYNRIDGKWEVAITYDGPTFVIVDSYSPDEMRLIGPDGRSYDKDPLRNWYKDNFPGWIASLEAAKREWPKDKARWPAYPKTVPPTAVLDDLRERYRMVAEAIGAI